MIIRDRRLHRAALRATRAGALGCATMLTLTIWSFSSPGRASAATDGGAAQVVNPVDGSAGSGTPLTAGASATPFTLRLPAGAACTGDSANDGYRVQSYMVPSTVSPAALTFDFLGPTPQGVGTSLRQPLYTIDGNPYVNAQSANATPPGGPGPVINIPAFSFAVYQPGDVPGGTYNVGIACTKGNASPTQLDVYWNAQLVVTASPADEPAGFTWTAQQTAVTSTTSTSTTTTVPTTSGSTTTTASTTGSTTTTPATTASDSTTSGSTTGATTLAPVVSGASAAAAPTGGVPSSPSVAASFAELPRTGGSTTSLVVWSLLLLVFGRMAVLLGRTPAVRPRVPA